LAKRPKAVSRMRSRIFEQDDREMEVGMRLEFFSSPNNC
jgi:hypothetical protein